MDWVLTGIVIGTNLVVGFLAYREGFVSGVEEAEQREPY